MTSILSSDRHQWPLFRFFCDVKNTPTARSLQLWRREPVPSRRNLVVIKIEQEVICLRQPLVLVFGGI